MARTVDEIAEILDALRSEEEHSNKNLEKILTDINSKLETMSDDDELIEIFRVYVSELKKAIEDGYIKEVSKFEELQNNLNNNIEIQNKLAKTEEIKGMFDSFDANVNNMLAEIKNKQLLLDDISKKISEVSLKSFDKNEIIPVIENVSSNIDSINKNIENSYDNIAEIVKNIDLSEKAEQISTAIKALDFTSDIENVLSKINEIKNSFDNTSKNNYNNIVAAIDEVSHNFDLAAESFKNSANDSLDFSEIVASLDSTSSEIANLISSINDNSDSNYEAVKGYITELSSNLSELQENFKEVTTQNISKYMGGLDNIDLKIQGLQESLTTNSKNNYESLKLKLEELSKTLASMNTTDLYNEELNNLNENIAGSINDIRLSFENNSKMNYENIVNEIGNLKTEIYTSLKSNDKTEEVEEIKETLSDLLSNIQFIRDISAQRYTELLENTTLEIHSALSEISGDIATGNDLNFADIKSQIEKLDIAQQDMRKEISEANNSRAFVVSNGFNTLKSTVENLTSIFSTFRGTTERIVSENSEKVSGYIKDLSVQLDDLKSVVGQVANIDKIQEAIMELANRIDAIDNKEEPENEELEFVKEDLSKISSQINLIKLELEQNYKDGNEQQIEQIGQLGEKINSIKTHVDEVFENIKDYVEEIGQTVKEDKNNSKFDIIQKLADIEAAIIQSSQDYDYKSESLQAKLGEFVQTIEGSNFDTEGKISASLEGISSLKDNLVAVAEGLKALKMSNDEKLNENVSLLDAGIENIIFNINSINENLQKVLDENVKDGFVAINDKLSDFAEVIKDIKNESLSEEFVNQVEEKTNAISEELKFVNNDITEAYKNTLNKISDIEECLTDKIQNDIELINASIASGIQEIKRGVSGQFEDQISELKESINVALSNKNISEAILGLRQYLDEINSKIDVIATSNSDEYILDEFEELNNNISEQKELIKSVSEKQISVFDSALKSGNDAIKHCFDEINAKIDILASDASSENILNEVDEIKDIILEQKKMFESSSDEKLSAIDKYLKDVLVKLDNVDFEKNAEDIKESILNALVSLIDQISFVEEAEGIKDFVEEKTGEINKNIEDVQNQLKQLATSDDAFDYKYTLQDVESDIARLRLAINNMQGNDLSDFSSDINKIVDIVENIESTLTQEQVVDLKSDFEKLNEDIVSISTRTNKLLLNSDESYKVLNDGLNNFSEVINKLEDRINYLDNTKITERIEQKIDNLQNLAFTSANADKVFHQAMMYLGEWVDSTTENILSISNKASQISEVEKRVEVLQETVPNKDDIISEIKEALPDNKELLSRLVSKFELQEARIDALENKLDKLVSIMEEKDDTVLNRKVDKLEKLMSKLDNNIEKLTSYVDEE